MKRIFFIFLVAVFGQAIAQIPASIEIDLGNHEQVRRAIELPNGNLILLVNEAINADAYFPYFVNTKLVKISPSGSVLTTQSLNGFVLQEMKRIDNYLFLVGSDPFSGGAFNARKYDLNFNLLAQRRYKQNGKLFVSRDISQVVLDSVFQNILIVDSLNQGVSSIGVLKIDTNLNYRLIQLPNTVVGASKIGFNSNTGKLYNLLLENNFGVLASNFHEVGLEFNSLQSRSMISSIFSNGYSQNHSSNAPVDVHFINSNRILASGMTDLNCSNFFQPFGACNASIISLLDSNLNRISEQLFGEIDTSDYPVENRFVRNGNFIYHFSVKNWSTFDLFKPEPTYLRVVKLDLNATVVSESLYSYNNEFFNFYDAIKLQNGNMLLVGSTYDSLNAHNEGLNMLLLQLDTAGNILTGLDKIEKLEGILGLTVYPNPFQNVIHLEKNQGAETLKLQIFDTTGRLIEEMPWNTNEINISTSQWNSGIYIYTITDKEGRTTSGKLVKTDL
jgi:hypothetical protein